MFQLTKPTEGFKLLQWIKELPTASSSDPLGLNLRVSARLANELLYCITSITPRARYYSFFPWAFQDYNNHERSTRVDRGRVKGVLSRERAMVLGAVIHHNGPCEGGSLGGSDKALDLSRKKSRAYDLSKWQHLQAPEGQFGAAYKGSLINLGVFKTGIDAVNDEAGEDSEQLNEETQSIDVRELSPLGERLANAFAQSVHGTEYVKKGWTLRNTINTDVLVDFGSRAGLCEIAAKRSIDRDVLRDVFFSRYEEMSAPSQHRRRMSLLLILDCVGRAHDAGIAFNNECLSDLCYYNAIGRDNDNYQSSIPVPVDKRLTDIARRWRVYYAHSYLAVAMQSLLVACVRVLRDHRGGIADGALLKAFSASTVKARFREVFGRDLPKDFFALTPRETLNWSGIKISRKGAVLKKLSIKDAFSERTLENLLIDGEANDSAGIALAAILLYQILLRYPAQVTGPFQNWYLRQIYAPYADVSMQGVAEFLRREFSGAWLDRPNEEVLGRVIWRYVIRQHQQMSYERGFGGTAPLFHVDGSSVISTNTDYTDPRMHNPRLGSALQILSDLGFLTYKGEAGYQRTEDGDTWLETELCREPAP